MPSVTIRFYQELNDFLPAKLRKAPSTVEYRPGCTVKAIIEDLGVPHTEVDLVLADGQSVGFDHRVRDGMAISVYPTFESWDISSVSRVRAVPLRVSRFALDGHLGKLARLLRMLGFDAWYENDVEDEALVQLARREARIALSRDRGLLKRKAVTHGYLVRSLAPLEQLAEVLQRFDLFGSVKPFSRCMTCNAPLERVPREDVLSQLPPAVVLCCAEFSRCTGCDRVFWRGTHWERMNGMVSAILERKPGSLSPLGCAGE
jgi:uncharacterized protein with PIN domain